MDVHVVVMALGDVAQVIVDVTVELGGSRARQTGFDGLKPSGKRDAPHGNIGRIKRSGSAEQLGRNPDSSEGVARFRSFAIHEHGERIVIEQSNTYIPRNSIAANKQDGMLGFLCQPNLWT